MKEKQKIDKYAADLENMSDVIFKPFVIESLGGRGKMTSTILDKIARGQSYLSGTPVDVCKKTISKGLCALFCKEMVSMWKANFPDLNQSFDRF